MQFTPLQIKEKLLKALDDDNNVVDAEAVLEVISILEKYPITRDALEQTRIGKHMNELRKKTNNDQLARRAKKLVRNWQRLVSSDAPDSGRRALNGERVVTPPQHPGVAALQRGGNGASHGGISSPALSHSGKNSPVPGRRCMSPAMAGSRPVTPQQDRVKCGSPALQGGKPRTPTLHGGQPRTPTLQGGKPGTPTLQSSGLSPGLRHSPTTVKPSTPSLTQSPRTGQGGKPSPLSSGRSTTPTLSSHPVGARASPLLSNNTHTSSPAHKLASTDGSPRLNQRNTSSPKSHSPKPDKSSGGRPSTPSGRAYGSGSRPGTPCVNEDSNSSWHSEHEKNNSNSRTKSKSKFESESGPKSDWKRNSSQTFASKSNHSTVVSNSSDKGSRKDQSDISKTNIANRKRTRTRSPDSVPMKQPKPDNSCLSKERQGSINGVVGSHKHRKKDKGDPSRSNSAASITYSKGTRELSPVSPTERPDVSNYGMTKRQNSKTSKVKTTEELIADLQKREGSSNIGTQIMCQLKSNQIEKELDTQTSILPPGVKPRKKRGMSSDNLSLLDNSSSTELLSQTKNEMMEKFLESSVTHSASDRLSPFKDDNKWESTMDSTGSYGDLQNDSLGDSASVDQERPKAAKFSTSEVKTENGIEGAKTAKQLTMEEILRLLPPLDVNSVDWEAHDYTVGELPEGTEEEVERLHTENWENVNGCFDVNGQWHDWSQTLSRASCDGDLLHILPYVNIDD